MPTSPIQLLHRHFGFTAFRPGQEELVRAVLSGRDALGVLPTGGGKSVCYQVPALRLGGITVVIAPLVSLMEDQVGRAKAVGVRSAQLTSVQSREVKRAVVAAAARGELDLLFVSPERLEVPSFLQALAGLDVRLLAIDEAHCISEWGHDFRPSYHRIGRMRSLLSCPVLALTATATPDVREEIRERLALRDPLVVVRSFDRPNLVWTVRRAGSLRDRISDLYCLLAGKRGAAIVYAPTRRTVERVRNGLANRGLKADAYHAGLPGHERSRVQKAFMADECRVVVATNAFGMGIDKADVRIVAHVQLPLTLEAYYQEAGRAGRDGAPSECVALYARGDRQLCRNLVNRAHPSPSRLRSALRQLRASADERGLVQIHGTLRDRRGRSLAEEETAAVIGALERHGAISEGPPAWREKGTDSVCSGSLRTVVKGRMEFSAAGAHRRRVLSKLAAVLAYARNHACRRRTLLSYFGEVIDGDCGACDRCAGSPN